MDPLSIGSAVVGLIAAATRITPVLYHFVTHTKDAPKTASQILDELNSITAALERLQTYLMGASTTHVARRSLLSLRNIIATLTACVTTYSDLERVVGKCVDNGKVKRIKWIINEGDISELVQRVQAHKLSLTLMLTILQCESMQEAETSMNRLVDLVEGLVTNNADLQIRIDALAMDHASLAPLSATSVYQETSSFSPQEFETDLSMSRPYRKLRPRDSIWTISSSQRGSMALSVFSDLTLGNVSVISVLCLPVWSTDLSNAEYYQFGKDGLELTITEMMQRYPEIEFPDLNDITDSKPSKPKAEDELFWTKKLYEPKPDPEDTAIGNQEKLFIPDLEKPVTTTLDKSFIANLEQVSILPQNQSATTNDGKLIERIREEVSALNREKLSAADREKLVGKIREELTTVYMAETSTKPKRVQKGISELPTIVRGASSPSVPSVPKDEPEVLFLAASLFEFNIEHDRREGGIPYLVYVPGEIFDVIGIKGELWLARNQDDPENTVGWIWEKHFTKILPEDAGQSS